VKFSPVLVEAVRPHWRTLSSAVFCVLFVTGSGLAVPLFFGRTVDALIKSGELDTLGRAGGWMVALFLLRALFQYGQIYANSAFAHAATAGLRARIFDRVLRWPVHRANQWHSGEISSRSFQDTQLIHTHLLVGLVDLIGTLATVLGTVVMLFILQWRLAAAMFVLVPATALVAKVFGGQIQAASVRSQRSLAMLATHLRDAVGGARVVRAFVQERRERDRFDHENRRLLAVQRKMSRHIAVEISVVSLATALGLILFFWIGGQLVKSNLMTAGGLISFVAYVAMAIEPGANLARIYGNVRQANGALARIEEIVNVPVAADPPGARDLPAAPAEIVFDRVGLSYEPNVWALRDVSFRIRPGEHVALVGPSGAGKSSILSLLLRFYDPSEGTVRIAGADVTTVRTGSLRRQIAYVPQETVLFAGTVRENIAYGRPDASFEDVRAAARAANADDFIATMPNGYDTSLAEAGLNLSGGQRQRIAIARALLLAPKIILLDEATSSLDTASEALVQEAVDRLTEGRTAILIAHRLSTVRGADRILVMHEGNVIEEGTYAELLRRQDAFWRLAQAQLIVGATPNPTEASA